MIVFTEEWDKHKTNRYIFQDRCTNQITGSFYIEYKDDEYPLLAGFYVQPSFRNTGIGKKMMRRVMNELVHQSGAWLMVRKDNTIAINLYKQFGFEYHSDADEVYEWMLWNKNNQ